MNGAECDFVHNDPLKQLSYDSTTRSKFLGEEVDVNYRAALEISRTGELSLRVPEELPSVIAKPRPLPRGVPSDVSIRYDKLLKVRSMLLHCHYTHTHIGSSIYVATISCSRYQQSDMGAHSRSMLLHIRCVFMPTAL